MSKSEPATRTHEPMRAHRHGLALVALLALLAGAAGGSELGELEALVRDRGLDPEEVIRPLRLTPELVAWAAERVPQRVPERTRLGYLLEALQGSKDPEFEYRPGHTGTVAEVFATGEYNCLSFSMLFVALARHMGMSAYFLNIDRDQEFEKVGDLVVVSRHITAGYGFVKDRTVLEFDLGPEVNYQLGEPASDLEALALYYSNRGAELLREGNVGAALGQLDVALTLMPELAQGWVNFGVALRRVGQLDAAEEAYLRAIELERRNLVAYENLMKLQRLRGRDNAADEVIEALDRRQNRNPFTFLTLGDLSLDEGRVEEAGRFYRRALRLARYEAETHAAMGLWALAAGRVDKARSWLKRAHGLDAENARALELDAELAERFDVRVGG